MKENAVRRIVRCLATALVPLAFAAAALAAPPPELVSFLPGQPALSRAATAGRRVNVDLSLVARGAATFRIALPDGRSVVAVRDGFEARGAGNAAWRGRVGSENVSRVVLTAKNGYVVGRIVSQGALYELRTLPTGGQVIERLDPARFAECAGDIPAPGGSSAGQSAAPPVAADTPDQIKVMSLYTPLAKTGAGGRPQIEATIQAAVDNMNAAFIDSDMIARITLIHTEESTYNDSSDMSADLSWLASDAGVAALRDQHAADMVSLIVNSGSYCGMGYVMRNPGHAFEKSAFQVTARSCAVGNLSFAHEHGHNMGFEHDPANGPSSGSASFPWSFGHFVDGSYRTVMSYSNQCSQGCSVVMHFSNPEVVHNGQPTGIADECDNARTGDLTAPIVADFRLDPVCGNGEQDGTEACDGADLGAAACSDFGCSRGTPSCTENCTIDYSTCTDCSSCDNDGLCETDEDCNACPNDCISAPSCGNGICEAGDGEDCLSCPADCRGKTKGNPSQQYCCGERPKPQSCSDPRCTAAGYRCTDDSVVASCCGDGTCRGYEDGFNCEVDCGAPSACGDGNCDPGENSCSCAADCGAPPATESVCDDGIDEDCDGSTDCNDNADCAGNQACSCEEGEFGDPCTDDDDCCSSKCKGPRGSKTCR